MVSIVPTFHFDGRCAEALELYQKAFHAQLLCKLHYADARKEDFDLPLTEEQKGWIYHSELMIGDRRLMLSDCLEFPFQTSMSCFLTVSLDTDEEVQTAYDVLKEGGTILVPIGSTTYSSCRGVLLDRFGFRWGLMTEHC